MMKTLLILWLTLSCGIALQAQSIKKHTRQYKSFTKCESRIIDTVFGLKEVVEKSLYVKHQTQGKRHLQCLIWAKPTKEEPYYWVKIIEDNGVTYYTHFNFYVYPKSFVIKYLDTVNDNVIDLATWRKGKN